MTLRSRIVIGYTLFLLAVTLGLIQVSDDRGKGMISMLNIVLIVIPLVSLVFSTIHLYNSYEFIELLAAQPLRRTMILIGEFIGLGIALTLAVLVGLGLPSLLMAPGTASLTLTLISVALTWIFVSIAVLASVSTRDKARGIGMALLIWFFFSLLYDALVLMLMFALSDYPLEKGMVALAALNPIDLARILMLLQLDIAALMGYTGALFREFLGTGAGMAFAAIMS